MYLPPHVHNHGRSITQIPLSAFMWRQQWVADSCTLPPIHMRLVIVQGDSYPFFTSRFHKHDQVLGHECTHWIGMMLTRLFNDALVLAPDPVQIQNSSDIHRRRRRRLRSWPIATARIRRVHFIDLIERKNKTSFVVVMMDAERHKKASNDKCLVFAAGGTAWFETLMGGTIFPNSCARTDTCFRADTCPANRGTCP